MSRSILRLKEVQRRTGLSRSGIYRALAQNPNFPKPVPIGARIVGWVEDEVDAFVDAMIAAGRSKTPPARAANRWTKKKEHDRDHSNEMKPARRLGRRARAFKG